MEVVPKRTLMVGNRMRGEVSNWSLCRNLIPDGETFVRVPDDAVPICLQTLTTTLDVLETIRRFLDAKSTHEWTRFGDPKSIDANNSWEYGALKRLNAQDVLYLIQACEKLAFAEMIYALSNYFVNVVHLQPPKTTQYQLQPLVHGAAHSFSA